MNDTLSRQLETILALFLTTLLFAGAALAETDEAQTYRFQPISAYELEIDGQRDPGAGIYHSAEAGAILVITDELSSPIALVPANKTIQRLAKSDLDVSHVGFVDMPGTANRTAVGSFDLVNNKPIFDIDGRTVRFLDRSPLLGKQTIDSIIDYDKSYGVRAEQYTPQEEYLVKLRELQDEVLVEVYMSTQCQVCQDLVPHIIKVAQELEGSKVRFEFYGLSLPASGNSIAKEKGLTGVPTGIMYRQGQEVGRAYNYSWRFPALAIYNTLLGIAVDLPEDRLPPSRR